MHESKTAHRRTRYLVLLLLTLTLFIASLVLGTVTLYAMNTAAKTHHAGIVVQYGNGKVINRCVDFTDDNFTGLDLLTQTDLDVVVDANNAMGVAVCKIGKDGCNNGSPCFCQCQGEACIYWSYWQLQNGAWQYSSQGPSNTTIHNGDVDGWIWGAGTTSSANPPTLMTFDQICTTAADPTQTATDVPPTKTKEPTDTPTSTITLTLTPTSTATNTPTETLAPPTETRVVAAEIATATKKPRATLVAQAEPTDIPQAEHATDSPPPSDTPTPRPTLGQPKRTPTRVSVAQASDSNSTDNGQET